MREIYTLRGIEERNEDLELRRKREEGRRKREEERRRGKEFFIRLLVSDPWRDHEMIS